MRKILIFSFAIIMFFCQIIVPSVRAISDEQSKIIVDNCDSIQDDLKKVQKSDAKVRVYLGRYYETILNKFITPLNVRLVENNLSDNNLIDNQNSFANARASFVADFVEYQKALEELVGVNCKSESDKFYSKLEDTRKKRSTVKSDVVKLNKLASKQVELVKGLEEKL